MFSTGTSLPVSLYVYDKKVESAVRINARARLYVKLSIMFVDYSQGANYFYSWACCTVSYGNYSTYQ